MLLLAVTHMSILSALRTSFSHFSSALSIPALETFLQAPRPSSHRRSVNLLARALIIWSHVDWCEPPKTCLPITQAHRESYQGYLADQHATLKSLRFGHRCAEALQSEAGSLFAEFFCPPLLTPASFPFTFGTRSISCFRTFLSTCGLSSLAVQSFVLAGFAFET